MALISLLARDALDLQRDIVLAENQLDDLKKALVKIVQEDLPEVMRTAGVADVRLTDGSRIQVVREVRAHIAIANAAAAHEWLRANGYGDLIKDEVIVKFSAGEDVAASALIEALSPDYNVARKEAVHASTLKAFIREQLSTGQAIPVDLFGVFEFDVAKIKPAD